MIELHKMPVLWNAIQRAVARAGVSGRANILFHNGIVEIVNVPGSCSVCHVQVRFDLLSETFEVVNRPDIIPAHRERPVKKVIRESPNLPDWDNVE